MANNVAFDGYSAGLAQEQWKIEVANWFSITLAGLQISTVEAGTGPSANAVQLLGMENVLNQTDTKEMNATAWVCDHILLRDSSGRYTTFSLLGITLTFLIGFMIVLLSFTLEPCLARATWGPGRAEKIVAWRLDSALQLFRMADEGAGNRDEWASGLVSRTPVTKDAGVKIGMYEAQHDWRGYRLALVAGHRNWRTGFDVGKVSSLAKLDRAAQDQVERHRGSLYESVQSRSISQEEQPNTAQGQRGRFTFSTVMVEEGMDNESLRWKHGNFDYQHDTGHSSTVDLAF